MLVGPFRQIGGGGGGRGTASRCLQWNSTLCELTFIIEGATEKVYKSFTQVKYNNVRQLPVTCHFYQ
jgi:hypothetical protein